MPYAMSNWLLSKQINVAGVISFFLVATSMFVFPKAVFANASETIDENMPALNGIVYTLVHDDTYIYLGGSFSSIGVRTQGAAELSAVTGLATKKLPVFGGTVYSSASDGNGGWYVGGSFTTVDGLAKPKLVHLLTDGSLDPAWNPTPNGTIYTIAVSGSDVYVGGLFTTIGGLTRNNIAKLNATTGVVDPSWDANATAQVNSLVFSGSYVYVGGNFITIGGLSRNRLARLDTTTGSAEATWNPNASSNIDVLYISGTEVYVGGAFTSVGGQSRQRLAKLSTTSSSADVTWDPSPDSSVFAITQGSDGYIYVGGSFGTIAGVSRSRVAKLHATTGVADINWLPSPDAPVRSLYTYGTNVYLAGEFNAVDALAIKNIARVSMSGTVDSSWIPNSMYYNFVYTLSGYDSSMFLGGNMTSPFGGTPCGNLVRLRRSDRTLDTSWNPYANGAVYALAVSGSDIYVGGTFTNISGTAHTNVAKISTVTGTADTLWQVSAPGRVTAIAIAEDNIYVGGVFTTINGQAFYNIAKLNNTTGAVDVSWNPALNQNGYVNALVAFGSTVYAGGRFSSAGGQTHNYLVKLDSVTATPTASWEPALNNEVHSLDLTNSQLYVGGDFTSVNDVSHRGIFRLNALTGEVDSSWVTTTVQAVNSIHVVNSGVYLGGNFYMVNGTPRNILAKVSAINGSLVTSWLPVVGGGINAIDSIGEDVYVGGVISTSSAGYRNIVRYAALPGVSVFATEGTTVLGKTGNTDSFTVQLDTQPTAAVTLGLTAPVGVQLSTASLTFTTENWQTPQTVTLNASDTAVSGNVSFVATSVDGNYNALSVTPLPVTLYTVAINLNKLPHATQDFRPIWTGTVTTYEAFSIVSLEYSLDNSPWTSLAFTGTNPASFTYQPAGDLSVGAHTFSLRATDSVATPSLITDGIDSFIIDVTLPTGATNVTITGLANSAWTRSHPTFTWTAGTDNSTIFGYCLSLQEQPLGDTPSLVDPIISAGILSANNLRPQCPYIQVGTSFDTSAVTLTSTKEYYLSIKTIDDAGNVYIGTDPAWQNVASFKYDSDSPLSPSLISAPSTYQSSKAITICWSSECGATPATDVGSQVAGFQYRIGDTGTWYGALHTGTQDLADLIPLTTQYYTFQEIPDYANLSEGVTKVYLRAMDNSGNVSTPIYADIKLNLQSPSEPLNLMVTATHPKNGDDTTSDDNLFSFMWNTPQAFVGPVEKITYCYTVNQLPSLATCTYTGAGVTMLMPDAFATLPGTNTFFVVARDEAGNINYAINASVTFVYSGSAPSIPLNFDATDISVKISKSWKIALAWSVPNAVGAGNLTYRIYRSTVATTCAESFSSFTNIGSSTGTSYSDNGLLQGTYYYCIKACDSANNCSASSTTAHAYPDGKFTTSAELTSKPEVTSITTKRAKISWVTSRESNSKIAFGTKAKSYSAEEVSNTSQVTDHVIHVDNLKPSTKYYYVAKWTDEDGNTGISDEGTFKTSAEPTVRDVKLTYVGINEVNLSFTLENAAKAKVIYGKSTAFGGIEELTVSSDKTTYTVLLAHLEEGTKYYYKVNTLDAENVEYSGTTLNFETLPRPKISDAKIYRVTNAPSSTVLLTWESNTEITSTIAYQPNGDASKAKDASDITLVKGAHEMFLTELASETLYSFTLTGKDKSGNSTDAVTLVFKTPLDTRPPKILDMKVESQITSTESAFPAQLIVTWSTDEPATSQVYFGDGNTKSYSDSTPVDNTLTRAHRVLIPNIPSATVYHLKAESKDSGGNLSVSDDTVTLSAKSSGDAMTIVVTKLRSIFIEK